MHVTRDVVRDLLPLYVAGEASPDTIALVDGFLADDEELAAQVRALRDDGDAVAQVTLPPEIGRIALSRTRMLLRRRAWLLAGAILCTALPFSLAFSDGTMTFFMLRDAPQTARLLMVLAGLLWAGFIAATRRLRVTGL
jgi:anti-sigma factor RsiW